MQNNKLGLGCGSWDIILRCYNKGPDGVRARDNCIGLYQALEKRGVIRSMVNDPYRFVSTDRGAEMAEWFFAVSQSPNVRIRFKRVPSSYMSARP